MAIREVVVSDISGEDIPDDQHTRLVINEHPDLTGPVELDVTTGEAARLQSSKLDLVTVTIYEPNTLPRRAVIEAASFAGMFSDDIDTVLTRARRSHQEGTATPRKRRTGPSTGTRAAKVDYTASENFGVLHRGKVTEAEAELVRNDLKQANANRARAGQPAIDVDDAKEKKRYGL